MSEDLMNQVRKPYQYLDPHMRISIVEMEL